jgi:hypothetical protein
MQHLPLGTIVSISQDYGRFRYGAVSGSEKQDGRDVEIIS